jgi:hypothetical protein
MKIKSTLTLALSRRERGLTAADVRNMPTFDTESNSSSESPTNRLPLQGERAGVRGKSTTNSKPTTLLLTTQQ